MRARFLVPPSAEESLADFDAAIAPRRPQYQAVAKAFRHNLTSALSTVSMPFNLAFTSVNQSHLQRIHVAERIRARNIDESSLHPGEELEAVRDREARTKAHSRMGEFVQSEDGQNTLIRDTCEFLLASLEHGLEGSEERRV